MDGPPCGRRKVGSSGQSPGNLESLCAEFSSTHIVVSIFFSSIPMQPQYNTIVTPYSIYLRGTIGLLMSAFEGVLLENLL